MAKSILQPVTVRADNVQVYYEVFQSHAGMGRFRRRENVVVEALRGVSFELNRGDALGLVGHNGAGKSTLIQVISGAVVPTGGSVGVSGVPQRLSVAWALNPAISGRKNCYLGLLAQGLMPGEARELIPDVISAAKLGPAIERPMRTYSSGMRARLGFAIATVRTPEILLLDEALAVGDKKFRSTSMERVRAIRDEAGTVIIATHNLQEIEETCNKALWLHDGKAVVIGEPDEVLAAYRRSGSLDFDTNMERMERKKRQKRQDRQKRQKRQERAQERSPRKVDRAARKAKGGGKRQAAGPRAQT